jgi:hypothetical protein
MPEIKSWQDYPEFLQRVEEEFDVVAEDLADLTLSELASAVYWLTGNPKAANIAAARGLRQAITAVTEGVEGARLEHIETTDRWIWRDIATGRFTRMPTFPE